MKLDLDLDIEDTRTTRCGLKIFCANKKKQQDCWWRRVDFLVSTLPKIDNLAKENQELSFYEITLTYAPKKMIYDGQNERLQRMIEYIKYLNKNKFNYFFFPEYHSNGESCGQIHWHGILYNRDYVATNRATAYWSRKNGRVSYVKKEFASTGELTYDSWLKYCTKDADKMDYNETPIVVNV